MNQTARQIGGALGIAVLVMLLGQPAGADEALDRFQNLWTYGAVTAIVAGLVGSLIPRLSSAAKAVTDEVAPEPVVAGADLSPPARAR